MTDEERAAMGKMIDRWHRCFPETVPLQSPTEMLEYAWNEALDFADARSSWRADESPHIEIDVGGYLISYYHGKTYWITGPDGDGMQTSKAFEKCIAQFFKENM